MDWNKVEQRELLTEAKRLLETVRIVPLGTAEEFHAPDAEAEATDSEPEAHVVEPLADDHSSDGEDTPTGVEESAVPAAPAVGAAPERAAMSLLERLKAIRIFLRLQATNATASLPPCRAWKESCGAQSGYQVSVTNAPVRVRVNRVDVDTCCFLVFFTFFDSSICFALKWVK